MLSPVQSALVTVRSVVVALQSAVIAVIERSAQCAEYKFSVLLRQLTSVLFGVVLTGIKSKTLVIRIVSIALFMRVIGVIRVLRLLGL